VRAVLDPNVLISALLSPTGPPARVLTAWIDGAYELVVSSLLLTELRRALAYPKLRGRMSQPEAEEFVGWLARSASVKDTPDEAPPARSSDPVDDYLLALAAAEDAILVSSDRHLLSLGPVLPIESPTRSSSGWGRTSARGRSAAPLPRCEPG
jgi:uncharacterized protein